MRVCQFRHPGTMEGGDDTSGRGLGQQLRAIGSGSMSRYRAINRR